MVMIIDSQVHAYAENSAERPWHGLPNWPDHVTGAEMVEAMDAVGVDGAILVSPFVLYRWDASYALEVHRAHPGKFALVKMVDPSDPAVGEIIEEWHRIPGTVAVRLRLDGTDGTQPDDLGVDLVVRTAARLNLPVNLLCWGNVDAGIELVDRNPDTRFVIDHLGLEQPRRPPVPDQPWAQLDRVLELAKRSNAVIKVSGACTLSHQPYPFDDIWEPLQSVFDAWGLERCLWGTDWTRAFAMVNYPDAVEPFRLTSLLTDAERATLMGGACADAYGWSPKSTSGDNE
jgi:L-fuconolactonase